jgi:hypothetical protein
LDESVTFNLDLNFLKFEHGVVPFEIEGKLEDTSIWYRETSFDKRLIGNWVLDSISPQIKFRFSETKSWNFSKPDAVSIMDDYRKSDSYVNPPTLTIDSTEFNYRTIGPLMEIMSKTDTIQLFRFSISNRGLILLDNYNKEKQILMFFRKK